MIVCDLRLLPPSYKQSALDLLTPTAVFVHASMLRVTLLSDVIESPPSHALLKKGALTVFTVTLAYDSLIQVLKPQNAFFPVKFSLY
jgi:hypothetical protein